MSSSITTRSKPAQVFLICFMTLPWLVFSIVLFNCLPEDWEFEHWPPMLRSLSVLAFIVVIIADFAIAIWFAADLIHDAYSDKTDSPD